MRDLSTIRSHVLAGMDEIVMKVVQLNSFEQIREYGVGWNDLLDLSVDNHIFMTSEWLEAWWKHFGGGRRLIVLAVEDNGKILALAPLMNTRYKLFKTGLRVIEFVGTPASDYQSFVLIADSSKCTRMILDYIKKQEWDCIELKNIPEDSETARSLKCNHGRSLKLKERIMDVCPYVPLPSTFWEYTQALRATRSGLSRLLQRERKLNKEHRVQYKSFGQMDITLEEAMNTFFKLHQQRWQFRGCEGIFAHPALRDFHMDIAKRFNSKGWLDLRFLTVDGKPISARYSFEYRQKMYAYQGGFDPDYSKYGVGNIIRLRVIESCINRGLKEYDMLRGDHSYKKSWGTQNRRTIELSAMRWKLVSKAYEWLVRSNIMPSLSSRLRRRVLAHTNRMPV